MTITAVIANYNHAGYLPRCLSALLAQTVRATEILVVDDGSTDGSLAVLDDFARRHESIRVIRNEKNLGVCPTFNRGIAEAKGRYCFLGAADDYTLPTLFEKLSAALAAHPHAGVAFGYDSHQHGDIGPVIENPSGWCDVPTFFPPAEVAKRLRCNLPGHAILIDTKDLQAVGGFRPELRWYSDWFAWLVKAFRRGAVHVPECLSVRVLLPEAYSVKPKLRDVHTEVLGHVFDLLRSSAFGDVAAYFRLSGAMSYFGTDVIRAAAKREDRFHPEMLGFLGGFTQEQYREAASDEHERVRELAGVFLQPQQCPAADEVRQKQAELEHSQRRIPPPGFVGKLRWLGGALKRKVFRV